MSDTTIPPAPAKTARIPAGLFALALGNAVCALAPNWALLLVGRIVAALCHGAFFGTGAVVATSLVPPDRKARAIGLMFTGLTVANVLGVPAAPDPR